MQDLPTVDFNFIESLLIACPKVEGVIVSADTKAYIMRGNSAIAKRMFFIRCVDEEKNQVTYDCAMAIAIKIHKIQEMKNWLIKHRNFNHG